MHKKMFINGEWITEDNNATLPVHNPATGEVIGSIPNGGAKEANKAVQAAEQHLEDWSSRTAEERGDLLIKWRDIISANEDKLSEIISLESGKPLHESKVEVNVTKSFLTWYAEEGKRVYGETIPASSGDKRILVIKQPIGVVGIITPWNFPAGALAKKIAPSLAAGCTLVVKPAEETPLTTILLTELAIEAGIPKGVINVVTGQPEEIGGTWLKSDAVKLITFTGSTKVGKILMKGAADKVKKLSLELGGHAPFIVFEDADLDKAVTGMMNSKFRNTGQTCVCANRIFVNKNILPQFLEKLKIAMKDLLVGPYDKSNVTTGPLINQAAYEKVTFQVEDAIKKGAVLKMGGKRIDHYSKGYFYEPTILQDVNESMEIYYNETFGPVIPIIAFEDEDKVINQANDTKYGLAAYIFTESLNKAIQISEKIESGIVGINDGIPSVAQAPFGGWKESGLGKEGGRAGLEEFLETKYISIQM